MMTISFNLLVEVVTKSRSLSQVVRNLGLPFNSRYTNYVRELIQQHRLDTSHFGRKRKYERITKICPVCKTQFETRINHRDEKTTCSYACANTHFRSGSDHPNFKPDNQSPHNRICWRYHSKRCVICGEDKIVAVHHYNENHDDNRPENLVPMCPTHHQYWHSRYRHLVQGTVDEYVMNFISGRRETGVLTASEAGNLWVRVPLPRLLRVYK